MDYDQIAQDQANEAQELADSAQDGAGGIFQPVITTAARLAVAAAAADDVAAALRKMASDSDMLQAIEKTVGAARRQALKALQRAVLAGFGDDARMRSKALAAASSGISFDVDVTKAWSQALKAYPILGHTPEKVAEYLAGKARYDIEGALGQPLSGTADPKSVTAALGDVSQAHGVRVAGAVKEGYYAGGKAATIELGKALTGGSTVISMTVTVGDIPGELDLTPERRAALQEGALDQGQVMYEYHTMEDDHVRPSHAALNHSVWSLGNPLAPVPPIDYGCFLPGTLVEGIFDGASRAWYHGEAVEVTCQSGRRLRVTPNHPIPTTQGLVPANAIQEGWQLLGYAPEVVAAGLHHHDEDHRPTAVEEVFAALSELGGIASTVAGREDFHGDAVCFDGKVQVVGSYAVLTRVRDLHQAQEHAHRALVAVDRGAALPGPGLRLEAGLGGGDALEGDACSDVCSSDLANTLPGAHPRPFHPFRVRLAAELDALGHQAIPKHLAADSQPFGYRIDGLPIAVPRSKGGAVQWGQMQALRVGARPIPYPCLYESHADGLGLNTKFLSDVRGAHATMVELDHVVQVRRFSYSGHVYDLRSPKGYVIADSLFASNCRCYMSYCSKPDTTAGQLLPVSTTPVRTKGEIFATALDIKLKDWKGLAEQADKLPASDRFAFLQSTLRKGMKAGDAKQYAMMILTASG